MNPKVFVRKAAATVGVGLCIVFCGCNVDAMRGRGQVRAQTLVPERNLSAGAGMSVDVTIADMQEVDLVEALVAHRTSYHEALRQLHRYYGQRGYAQKETWAAFELDGLKSVQQFRYMLDAEIPSASLHAEEAIEEADAWYERGVGLMRRGGHGIPGLYSENLMIQAAEVFRELIERYPHSDKIDDAAFMCGEIHREYLPGQELLAVKWYERAFMWNAQTPHPARFQAATVCDYRLHDRDRALELYQAVLKHEAGDKSNLRRATRRVEELSADVRTMAATD